MTAAEVLADLARLGVTATASPSGKIALETDAADVPPQALAIAGRHKQDLLTHLHRCAPHNNPANYRVEAGGRAVCEVRPVRGLRKG